jgi:hypothetical protein
MRQNLTLKATQREGLSLALLAGSGNVGYHRTSCRQWAESPTSSREEEDQFFWSLGFGKITPLPLSFLILSIRLLSLHIMNMAQKLYV